MEYNTKELDELINDWLNYIYSMKKAKTKSEEDKLKPYDMELMEDCIIKKMPNLALSIILKILDKDSSDIVMEVLSAGELEELLSLHGEKIIKIIEETAKKNSKFKKLLGGVWQGEMPDEIYKRVVIAAGGKEARW